MRKSPLVVYTVLIVGWLAIVGWQLVEHQRVRSQVQQGQLNHTRDIANTMGIVIRSQRRFGVVSRERLIHALEDLAKAKEILGITMLSPTGENVASGGQMIPLQNLAGLQPGTPAYADRMMTIITPIDFGDEPNPRPGSRSEEWTDAEKKKAAGAVVWSPERATTDTSESTETKPKLTEEEEHEKRRARWEQMRLTHPFWQSPEDYDDIYQKQGIASVALLLDDTHRLASIKQDCVVRSLLVLLALFAACGLGFAWRTITSSTDLQLRLIRAQTSNTYLRELNLAAAGLAHETRNPLNIVRGIAQLVAKDAAIPPNSRQQLESAVDEVDRITVRLNEFIDYSKPRQALPVPTDPASVMRDVARTLDTDLEDKQITFSCPDTMPKIMADPAMLRQVCFNLIFNATEAVPANGRIDIRMTPGEHGQQLQVIDNGPGVDPSIQGEIFRPYVTLSAHGSGLGLAIVRQIVVAHGWDIVHTPSPGGGATFTISGIALAHASA